MKSKGLWGLVIVAAIYVGIYAYGSMTRTVSPNITLTDAEKAAAKRAGVNNLPGNASEDKIRALSQTQFTPGVEYVVTNVVGSEWVQLVPFLNHVKYGAFGPINKMHVVWQARLNHEDNRTYTMDRTNINFGDFRTIEVKIVPNQYMSECLFRVPFTPKG